MRRISVIVVLTIAVLAPLAGVVGAAPPSGVGANTTDASAQSAPPDPMSDRLGWEQGYWYNETIAVNQTDGLSSEELDRVVSRTMARVEYLRQLEFTSDVPVDTISRAEYRNQSGSTGNVSAAFRAFDNAKFEALFLVNESTNSLEVQEANRGSSVGGYYSPSNDQIVLIYEGDSASAARIQELTLAHELMHAVQDQHFNLSAISGDTRDEVNANSGLIEGDARNLEHLYRPKCAQGGAWNGTCVSPETSGGGGGGSLANIGVYFVKYFPYADGPHFVSTIRQTGGWAAVNALYEAPPKSAEQVIHPEKYGTDAPANVSLSDELADGWSRVEPEGRVNYAELGQSALAAMFAYPLYNQQNPGQIIGPRTWLNYTQSGELSSTNPLNYGFDIVDGWDGDRMHVYRNAQNETGYVWKLVWDSPTDAQQFAEGYRQLLSLWGATNPSGSVYVIENGGFADAFHLSVSGDTVTIVNAPSTGQLTEVRTDLALSVTPTTASPTTTASETTGGAPATSSDGSTPGFGVGVALAALLAVAFLLRRR